MTFLRLDPAGAGALHERIAGMVRRALASGRLGPGDHLPPARTLADQLKVNVNTVLRAYRQLSAEKLVELRRGSGAIVQAEPGMAKLYELADDLLDEAARLGLTRGELVALLLRRDQAHEEE